MDRPIPSDELTPADIPAPDASWSEICKFAHTCDGYELAGDNRGDEGAAARIANDRTRPKSLDELRISLFFEFRADHFGFRDFAGSPDGVYVRRLVEDIRAAVGGS